jgi:hypothetical protein
VVNRTSKAYIQDERRVCEYLVSIRARYLALGTIIVSRISFAGNSRDLSGSEHPVARVGAKTIEINYVFPSLASLEYDKRHDAARESRSIKSRKSSTRFE